jgi:hypothetical protein
MERDNIISIISILVAGTLVLIGWYIFTSPDFIISINPMQDSCLAGGVIQTTVTVENTHNIIHKYKYPIRLSTVMQSSNQPIIITLNPSDECIPEYDSTVIIKVKPNVPAGDYTIIIKGIGANEKEHSCNYTLTIKPTVTPTTTPIITPTPTQSKLNVAITYPIEKAVHWTRVNGTVSRALEEGEYMWILVNSFDSPSDWWPQTGGPIIPYRRNLTWEGMARIGGGEQDIGKEFEIVVLIMDANLNSKFNDWQKECKEKKDWPSITNETYGKISKEVIEEKIFYQVKVVLKEGEEL